MKKRLLSLFLTICMMLTMLPVTSFAAEGFVDTKGHWSEASVQRWADYGIVKGMDGTHFQPESPMTRAQMATILANMLGLKNKVDNPFTDVAAGAWYEDAVIKCAAAGIMKGTSTTTASPESLITREQACVMLARALSIVDGSGSTSFSDAGNISDWAAGAVKSMTDRGILTGIGDNTFAPKANINRASVATILDRSITAYANKSGETVTASDKGITLIAAPDVTVTGAAQDVYIAPGASGLTKLDGVKVAGTVTMNAPSGSLELAGATTAAAVTVPEGADKATITVTKDASVDAFATKAADTKLNVEGKVQSADIGTGADNSAIAIAKNAEVGKLSTAADNVKVTGEGKVNDMTVSSGKGVTVAGSVQVGNITNNSSDNVTHGNKVIAGTGSSTTTPGGGGGGGGGGGDQPSTGKPAVLTGIRTAADLEKKIADVVKDTEDFNGTATATVEDDHMFKGEDASITIPDGVTTLTINLKDATLGNLKIDAATAKDNLYNITINGTAKPAAVTQAAKYAKIQSMTVNTPGWDVTNNVEVDGAVTVEAVSDNSFHQKAKAKRIVMKGKGAIDVAHEAEDIPVDIQSQEPVILKGIVKAVNILADKSNVKLESLHKKAEPAIASTAKVGGEITINSTIPESTSPVKLTGNVGTVNLARSVPVMLANANVKKLATTAAVASPTVTTQDDINGIQSVIKDLAVAAQNAVVTLGAVTVESVSVTGNIELKAQSEDTAPTITKVKVESAVSLNLSTGVGTVEITGTTAADNVTIAGNGSIGEVNVASSVVIAVTGSAKIESVNNTAKEANVTVNISASATITAATNAGDESTGLKFGGIGGAAITEPPVDLVEAMPVVGTDVTFTNAKNPKDNAIITNIGDDDLYYHGTLVLKPEKLTTGKSGSVTPGGTYSIIRYGDGSGRQDSKPLVHTFDPAPVGVETVTISGEPYIGNTLTAVTNDVELPSGVTKTSTWTNDDKAEVATGDTLKLDDKVFKQTLNKKLTVDVTTNVTAASKEEDKKVWGEAKATTGSKVAIDYRVVDSLIAQASELIKEIVPYTTDASDVKNGVKCAPTGTLKAVKDAQDAAVTAKGNAEKSYNDYTALGNSTTALKDAITALTSSITTGTGGDETKPEVLREQLTNMVAAAEQLMNSIEVNTSPAEVLPGKKFVYPTLKTRLKDAIKTAKAIIEDATKTVTQADIDTLKEAQDFFTNNISTGSPLNTADYTAKIGAAQSELDSLVVDKGNFAIDGVGDAFLDMVDSSKYAVTEGVFNKYTEAVNDARTALDAATTQAQVNAVREFVDDFEYYSGFKLPGRKTDELVTSVSDAPESAVLRNGNTILTVTLKAVPAYGDVIRVYTVEPDTTIKRYTVGTTTDSSVASNGRVVNFTFDAGAITSDVYVSNKQVNKLESDGIVAEYHLPVETQSKAPSTAVLSNGNKTLTVTLDAAPAAGDTIKVYAAAEGGTGEEHKITAVNKEQVITLTMEPTADVYVTYTDVANNKTESPRTESSGYEAPKVTPQSAEFIGNNVKLKVTFDKDPAVGDKISVYTTEDDAHPTEYTLKAEDITSGEHTATITLNPAATGDVWVCYQQSGREWSAKIKTNNYASVDKQSKAPSSAVLSNDNKTLTVTLEAAPAAGDTIKVYAAAEGGTGEEHKITAVNKEQVIALTMEPTADVYVTYTDVANNKTESPRTKSSGYKAPGTTHKVEITQPVQGGGTIAASVPEGDINSVASGTTVTLTATPNAGYEFEKFTVTGANLNESDFTFTMADTDVAVTATFKKIKYKVTINVTPENSGTVKPSNLSPYNVAPDAVYAAYVDTGTVTLEIKENPGYELEALKWVQTDGSDNDIKTSKTFTMPAADVTVTATFKVKANYTPTPEIRGIGVGGTQAGEGDFGFDYKTTYTNFGVYEVEPDSTAAAFRVDQAILLNTLVNNKKYRENEPTKTENVYASDAERTTSWNKILYTTNSTPHIGFAVDISAVAKATGGEADTVKVTMKKKITSETTSYNGQSLNLDKSSAGNGQYGDIVVTDKWAGSKKAYYVDYLQIAGKDGEAIDGATYTYTLEFYKSGDTSNPISTYTYSIERQVQAAKIDDAIQAGICEVNALMKTDVNQTIYAELVRDSSTPNKININITPATANEVDVSTVWTDLKDLVGTMYKYNVLINKFEAVDENGTKLSGGSDKLYELSINGTTKPTDPNVVKFVKSCFKDFTVAGGSKLQDLSNQKAYVKVCKASTNKGDNASVESVVYTLEFIGGNQSNKP